MKTLIRRRVLDLGLHCLPMSQPEDHYSCIAHLSAEDLLKSVVIEEKKCRGRQTIRAKIFMSTARPHHYYHLLQV